MKRNNGVEFIGRNYIDEPMLMVDMGAYPALVRDMLSPDTSRKIYGELYTIDPETLAALDYAEGHPHYYKREKIKTKDPKYPSRPAWVYLLTDDAADYAETIIDECVWKPIEAEVAYVKSNP
jgi:gamma-glutamylcyclotransferase (GGCT)/AIG2-like uncharacterized protein YtfP